MAMTYGGIQYYPISVILFDEIYMGLIEARYGMQDIQGKRILSALGRRTMRALHQ